MNKKPKSNSSGSKSASNNPNTPNAPATPGSSINDLVDPSSVVGSPPPPLTLPSANSSHHHYFKSDYSHLIRPSGVHSGFSPYYSSPKYSTPPLPSSESMLGSPIPDYTRYHQVGGYDHQLSGGPAGPQAPSSQPHSLTSVSPTSGVSINNHLSISRQNTGSPNSLWIFSFHFLARACGSSEAPLIPYCCFCCCCFCCCCCSFSKNLSSVKLIVFSLLSYIINSF